MEKSDKRVIPYTKEQLRDPEFYKKYHINPVDRKMILGFVENDELWDGDCRFHVPEWDELQMRKQTVILRWEEGQLEGVFDPAIHCHPFYEIILVKRGGAQYNLENKRIQVGKGDVILLPPGVRHQPILPEDEKSYYERYIMWLRNDFWKDQCNRYPELNYCFEKCQEKQLYVCHLPEEQYRQVLEEAEILKCCIEQEEYGWEAKMELWVLQAVLSFSQCFYMDEMGFSKTEKPQLFDKARIYIEQHLKEKLNVDQIAEELHVSSSTLSHDFQKKIGMSCYRYITKYRILEAKKCIRQKMQMKEVWMECGFGDYTTFYRAFCKEVGMSPKQYQELV